jgi:hypothetical protein
VRKSLHAFNLINAGCSAKVCNVSTLTSISSGEMMVCTFDGSNGFVSCGGLGMPVVVGFFTALVWAPLRFRFAILKQFFGQACRFQTLQSILSPRRGTEKLVDLVIR